MSIGYKGTKTAAKVSANAAIELLENDELRAEARREHEAQPGDGIKYEALLGDRTLPLDFRKSN